MKRLEVDGREAGHPQGNADRSIIILPHWGVRTMKAAIRVEELDKRFRQVVALDDVTMEVPQGSTYFLLGPNGSGKTTLVRLLTGVLRPTHGTIRVLDVDPYRQPHRLSRKLGVAYENHHLPSWAKARDYLEFASKARNLDGEDIQQAARDFELADYWDREMGTYSAGMRKRVMLAQAWLGDPELLLLDEPFSNLDPEGRRLLASLLDRRSSEGLTTLVATHLAETIAPPTHLACLLNGGLEAAGPVRELADQYRARSVAFELPDPAEGVRLLLERGITTVTASGDRVLVVGDSDTVGTAAEALRSAGLSAEPVEETYDIWAIYRSVLSGHTPRESDHVREAAASEPQPP